MRPFVRVIVALTVACGTGLAGAQLNAFQKADPSAFSGTWKLNAEASTNPNGPAQPQGGGRGTSRGGGGGAITGGGGGGGGEEGGGARTAQVTAGSGPGAGGSLGREEQARFYAMLGAMEKAPQQLALAATDKDVTITPDNAVPFHQATDGKKVDLPTGSKAFGSIAVKTKWDGPELKREMKTVDGLTVIETYTMTGPDRLTVSLELKSQVERLADWRKQPIERVYDRVK
jgi:hypothetical protein